MQGGCVCENTAYLRVGTTNIELAALTAPRPLGMTAANDWTRDLETKGLPELKAIYKMYGAEDKVMAKYLNFGHNYNQPSRAWMTDQWPAGTAVEVVAKGDKTEKDGLVTLELVLSRKGQGERVQCQIVHGKDFNGTGVIWIHPDGIRSLWRDGKLAPAAQALV